MHSGDALKGCEQARGQGETHECLIKLGHSFGLLKIRAVDPHSLYADPDPAVNLNADPDTDLDPDPGPGLASPNLKKKNHE